MKKKRKIFRSAILAIGTVVVVFGAARNVDLLLYIFFGPGSTEYAPGFTQSGFRHMHIGVTRTAVERLIGRGFKTFTSYPCEEEGTLDQPIWYYSINGFGSDNHWRYWVYFDEQDTVTRVKREFWWD